MLATPQLPTPVQQAHPRNEVERNSFCWWRPFVSSDNSMSRYDIANYLVSHVQDRSAAFNGVGNFNVFGTQYAMRTVWLDPNKLQQLMGLTPVAVSNALLAQNVQIASGPARRHAGNPGAAVQRDHHEATLLRTPEEFGQHPAESPERRLAGSHPGRRAVARGPENYNSTAANNGQPRLGIGVQLAPGFERAFRPARRVHAQIDQLTAYFRRD